jgi:tripartite-type tricarboxylate transporter receptor subunit TctC
MNSSRRQLNTLLGASLLSLGTAPLAWAQTTATPTPLKLIVPFTPGTGIDLIARTLGPKLSQRLNRPVVVENRVGASGNIGTEADRFARWSGGRDVPAHPCGFAAHSLGSANGIGHRQ